MDQYRGTTIVAVRRNDCVVIGGDGQVSLGNTIMKGNARKVRRLYKDRVLAGFAGGTADAFTLFERFEGKLEEHGGNLTRAAVELAKDWRTDRMLRRLEALLAVADDTASLMISGDGDVIEPEHGLIAIGSGGPFAQAAAMALLEESDLDAESIVKRSLPCTRLSTRSGAVSGGRKLCPSRSDGWAGTPRRAGYSGEATMYAGTAPRRCAICEESASLPMTPRIAQSIS